MGELLDSMESMSRPTRCSARGRYRGPAVMRADPDGILVNIGHKAEGIVPPGEMRTLGPEGLEKLQVGDEVIALVVRREGYTGGRTPPLNRDPG